MQRVRRTLADYDALPERTKADFIEGELVMAPPPTPWHEALLMRLVRGLADALGDRWDRRVFVSHFEIRVAGEAAQPDVVALPEGTRATGPDWKPPTPVFAAEILSPSTASHERSASSRAPGCARRGSSTRRRGRSRSTTSRRADIASSPRARSRSRARSRASAWT
jgi:hypothetical protein